MAGVNPKLSADERAFLNRLDCLNEEEIKQLTTRELFAYFTVIDKVILEPTLVEWWNGRGDQALDERAKQTRNQDQFEL